MALSQLFSISQTIGFPSKIILTDSSTGTDAAVVKRRVYITDKDGNYIVVSGTTTDYEEWDDFPATTTITLDLLTSDKAVNVRCDWLNTANTVLYTLTLLRDFTLYAKTYYFSLIKAQSSNPKLKDSANYYQNFIKLLVSIKEADDSVLLLSDISSSQAALNRANTLISSPSNFF